jgi:hypothetical protein
VVFSSIITCEYATAWPWSKKKDTNVQTLSEDANAFSSISRQAAAISTSVDGFTQKNYSAENDISHLLPFRALTKNVSELFNWIFILIKDVKSNFDKFNSAQSAKEKAKSEKSTEKAENDLSNVKEKIIRTSNLLFGNGVASMVANVKTSASVFLQVIKVIEFSTANVDSLRKSMAPLSKQCDTVAVAMRSFTKVFENIKEADGEDFEGIEAASIEKLAKDINDIADIMVGIDTYFQKEGLQENVIDDLLAKCSLSNGSRNNNDRGRGNDDDRDRSSNNRRNDDDDRSKSSRDSRYDDDRGRSGSASRYDDDDRGRSGSTSRYDDDRGSSNRRN